MSARHTAHPDPLVHLAIRQARHRIANPQELSHLPANERARLYTMAWAVLKSARGCTTAQRIRIPHGGDAA